MTDKILATFRLDPDIWQAFQTKAKDRRTNASRLLVEFVESYLENKSASSPIDVEQRLARVENQLTKLLSEVDARIEKTVGQQLKLQPMAMRETPGESLKLAQLQQQLAVVEAERDKLREQLARTQAERNEPQQEPAPIPPNYEAIARKVLDSLNLGVQSAGYKTAVKVLTEFNRAASPPFRGRDRRCG